MPTTRTFSLLHPYLKNLLLLMLLCTGLRALFFALNYQQFQLESSSTLLLAFVHGLRFDLATVTLCLAPWLLLSLLLYIFNWQRTLVLFSKFYWPLIPLVIIASNVADALYFPFTGRRSGPEVFSFSQDLADQAGQLLQQYWLLAALSVLAVLLFIKLSLRLLPEINTSSRPWYSRLAIAIGIFLFAALSIRSGLGSKPLSPSHAFNWPGASTGHLVLNSTFTLLRQDLSKLKKINFFSTDRQARQLNEVAAAPWPNPAGNDNVVIIVLESFALEYISANRNSPGYAPFLQQLMKQSLNFKDAYANGRRSIDALPAILAGLPTLMQEAFITSGYLGNNVSGLAQVLRREDYQSWFFHGAKNGSMHIDTMSKRFGFENYLGRNEYPDESDFDGKWGIYDEPFLQHMANTLNSVEKPFVAGVF
ncbi:MAG: sulfatase-like hydrolase/transferase, partial [Pseudomonadales bacterium]|nr:sulfatase-like hydrolase/transferase [Pseudomonadales bacterium]